MQDNFNLAGLSAVWKKHWQGLLLFTLLCGVATYFTAQLRPRYFKSTVTVVSANPLLADKARLFNNQIQHLYSYFGSGDDLDRLQGMADMDTVYKQLAGEFDLVSYYKLADKPVAKQRVAVVKKLRKNIHFQRTEEGQLRIDVWMKDAILAADIANRMVAIVRNAAENIWRTNYQYSYSQLQHSTDSLEVAYRNLSDSLPSLTGAQKELAQLRLKTWQEQISQYHKTAAEFALAEQTPPAALYVLEQASPALKATVPDLPRIIFFVCIGALLFGSLVMLRQHREDNS